MHAQWQAIKSHSAWAWLASVSGVRSSCQRSKECREIKLVAAADLYRPHALDAFKARYDGARTYQEVADLCADPDVDAIWIATPNKFHAQHALLAAQAGKHMCVRKPFGLTVEDCQKVLDAAEKTGARILAGGQTQGTNALIQTIRKMMLNDELGELRAINMWAFTGWMLRPREPQEVDDSQGGGIVWRQAPHQLETIRWIGGGHAEKCARRDRHLAPGSARMARLFHRPDGV